MVFPMVFYQGKSVPCNHSYHWVIGDPGFQPSPRVEDPRERRKRKQLKFRLGHLTRKKESSKYCFKVAIATVW